MMPAGATIAMGSKIYSVVEQRPSPLVFLSWIPYLHWLSFCEEDVTTDRQLVLLLSSHIVERQVL
jgi:hypothetical protein